MYMKTNIFAWAISKSAYVYEDLYARMRYEQPSILRLICSYV